MCYTETEQRRKIVNNVEMANIRKNIRHSLIKVGIRCDLAAFNYLCYAVELVVCNPELSLHLCDGVYRRIAEKFAVKNIFCVERSIRSAIDALSNTKGFSSLNKMFGAELYSEYEKPTSGEFINLMAEYHRIGLYASSI